MLDGPILGQERRRKEILKVLSLPIKNWVLHMSASGDHTIVTMDLCSILYYRLKAVGIQLLIRVKPLCVCTCACALSHVWLFCDSMDYSLSGPSIHEILQARTLEWVAIFSSRDLPDPGIKPESSAPSALIDGFFTTVPPRKPELNKYSALVNDS